jgi:nucleoid-associated protein YgaU
MIQISSRYRVNTEIRNDDIAVVSVRNSVTVPNYATHVSREGDSFESLASRFLGAPVFYWKIADINPQVAFPDYIPPGTLIRIPQ